MNTMDRNEDIKIGIDMMPADCYLQKGKFLPQLAKCQNPPIPFGMAREWVPSGKSHRWETVGLIIRLANRERFEAALIAKATRQKYPKTNVAG